MCWGSTLNSVQWGTQVTESLSANSETITVRTDILHPSCSKIVWFSPTSDMNLLSNSHEILQTGLDSNTSQLILYRNGEITLLVTATWRGGSERKHWHINLTYSHYLYSWCTCILADQRECLGLTAAINVLLKIL